MILRHGRDTSIGRVLRSPPAAPGRPAISGRSARLLARTLLRCGLDDGRDSRQGPAHGRIEMFAIANEGLDDLESRAGFALRASSLEIGRKFAIGPQHFLLPDILLGRITTRR